MRVIGRRPAALFLIFILTLLLTNLSYGEGDMVGTTFSQVQCEYLDMNWKEVYLKTLDMDFDIIRLGSYWSRIEEKEGVYDFSELDWQIQKAREKNKKVLLTVGMKAPRWPEYFIPGRIAEKIRTRPGHDVSENALLRGELERFIRMIVCRYQNEEAIYAWQVENEPFNMAGPRNWYISDEFLKKEMNLIKESDSRGRPIVINVLTQPNIFLRVLSRLAYKKDPVSKTIDLAEIPALNIYPVVGHQFIMGGMCFRTQPKERTQYLERIVKLAGDKGEGLWITELQAEPWEPGQLVHIKKEKAISCFPESFESTFKEVRSLGIDTVFLWGVEYWFYREHKYNDTSWLDSALRITRKKAGGRTQ